MVRTRADNCARKAVAAKAPRKVLGASSSGGTGCSSGMTSPAGKAGKYAGGNSVCPRPTPEWQKGIGSFFTTPNRGKENTKPEEDDTGVEEEEMQSSAGSEATAAATTCGGSSFQTSSPSDSAEPSSPKHQKNGLIDSDSDDE